MEKGSEFRKWDELIPDALGLIFKQLPLQDILTVIPRVCMAWGKAVRGPYCWQEIDIDEWSSQSKSEHVDQMLRLLIPRSGGSLRKLRVSRVNDDQTFFLIADHARSLQTLTLRRSEITDSIVEQIAGKLSTITSLDLSYCHQIGPRAFEAIGKNCKSLSSLSWNMHPLDTVYMPSHSNEARAIAKTMPKLNHLELAYLHMDTSSVLEILSSCPKLETLDLRGCWDVKLEKKFIEERHPELKVLGPHVRMGYFERRSSFDDCSDSEFSDYEYMDYSDDDSFDGMWDDEALEWRIYEGLEDLQELGWPPYP